MDKFPLSIYAQISKSKSVKINKELFGEYSDGLLMFAAVTCIVLAIIGVPSNLFTIIALLRGKQAKNSTTIFIINLSVSDLLFGCFILPLAASTFLQRSWTHSELLCRLFPLLRYGLLAVSLFTVSLITINRYIIIAHPRRYARIYQRRYLAMMVASTWITAFSIMIPTWRGLWGQFGLDAEIGSCSILRDKNDRTPKEFLFLIAFLIPFLCILFCYLRIYYLVRKAAFRRRDPVKNSPYIKSKTLQPNMENPLPNINDNFPKASQIKELHTDNFAFNPIIGNDDIEYIDANNSSDCTPISYCEIKKCSTADKITNSYKVDNSVKNIRENTFKNDENPSSYSNPIKTSLKLSFGKFTRKALYTSFGNTSNASSIYPGKMSKKDQRLLRMILVIFATFVICYLPITITKISKNVKNMQLLNISGYLLIYLTTCINPFIYVLMSSEYRQAYRGIFKDSENTKKTHPANGLV